MKGGENIDKRKRNIDQKKRYHYVNRSDRGGKGKGLRGGESGLQIGLVKTRQGKTH